MITTHGRTRYIVAAVAGQSIDTEAPCPECSDMDAFVTVNVYAREYGQTVRQYEACVPCGQRIALNQGAAEVLIEVPAYLAPAGSELRKILEG
jgi:hypothetical protein